MVNRDCNTCAHHIQAGGIDKTPAGCWSCLANGGLPGWERDWDMPLTKDDEKYQQPVPLFFPDHPVNPYQSRKESLLEATLNTLSGFILSYLVWMLVAAPLFNIPVNHTETFWITCLFTVVSVVRSYVWRRLFVNRFFWRKESAV